jgi:hypothetical protein
MKFEEKTLVLTSFDLEHILRYNESFDLMLKDSL